NQTCHVPVGFLHSSVKLCGKLGKTITLLVELCQHQETEVAGKLEEQRPDAFIRLLI
ncbi:MAG: hypothetical protein MOP49_1122, partial [Nitrososphaera sp.]|nr:hypothetical protein [Nitrososphaera sp.]